MRRWRIWHRLLHWTGMHKGYLVMYTEWPSKRQMHGFLCGDCGRLTWSYPTRPEEALIVPRRRSR